MLDVFSEKDRFGCRASQKIFVIIYFSLVHILWPFSFLSIHKQMLISHVFGGMAFSIYSIVWSTLPEIYLTILDWVRCLLPWFPLVCPSVQLLSRVRLFATLWIAARQASLSITNSQSSPKLMSIESVMPSSHLILCRPLVLLPPIPPSIRVFSNESVHPTGGQSTGIQLQY